MLLGDGPVFVSLYKQGLGGIFRLSERLDETSLAIDLGREYTFQHDGRTYVDWSRRKRDLAGPVRFEADRHALDVHCVDEDNHYVYARLTQPDGTVWHGFSGYGVGAGLEDCGYGYSTEDCVDRLFEVFPIQQGANQ